MRGYQDLLRAVGLHGRSGDDQAAALQDRISIHGAPKASFRFCRDESALSLPRPGPVGRSRLMSCVAWAG